MLTDQLKQEIQQVYSRYLKEKGHKPRLGQKQMIAHVAKTFAATDETAVATVEAGTGTGKTLSYLIPGIILAKAKKRQLVVSTATVALQEQLVKKDIPELAKYGELKFTYALAKGRGRYLCITKLEHELEMQGAAINPDMFTSATSTEASQQVSRLLESYSQGKWQGDFDEYKQPLDDQTKIALTATQHECSGRRCQHFSMCPYYRARNHIEKADVIIANHDLIMADQSLGGGVVLPEPESCYFVFDEAHHVPDKALSHFAAQAPVSQLLDGIESFGFRLEKLLADSRGDDGLVSAIESIRIQLPNIRLGGRTLTEYFQDNFQLLADKQVHRWPQGVLEDELVASSEGLAEQLKAVTTQLDGMRNRIGKLIGEKDELMPMATMENWYLRLGRDLGMFDNLFMLARMWSLVSEPQHPPVAKWLERHDNDWLMAASPVSAASKLRQQLWSRAAGVVLTSATLAVAGKFSRFYAAAGIPDGATELIVRSPFDYQRAVIEVPMQAPDGGRADLHTQWLADKTLELVNPDEANLVLFASRRQMQTVVEAWRAQHKHWSLLVQGELSRAQLLEEHRQAIDKGQGSTLVGLASLAEGVDLPGNYLTHVIIAKLPFGTPDDPIDATLSEWISNKGGNPFVQLTVPDAAIKLVQACGRLMRSESDHGRITILDSRLATKTYGRTLVETLPPFARSGRLT
ncbi:ATP-dependent DNA helicase DinG [Salinibius halmophilus]|uniref:ATP-dependent DNA helicase DinG n=1 Tax=Salinibius halmophilus TaxID=1853216 RepID=UPI000E676595|nr:ATP-dependent DNA helicase DinG [Salinibius halmophilus]